MRGSFLKAMKGLKFSTSGSREARYISYQGPGGEVRDEGSEGGREERGGGE